MKYLLQITPQTHVRTVQGDKILFRIPENCPHNCGKPRRKPTSLEGTYCPHMLSYESYRRKKRIERYNDYKEALHAEARRVGFILPDVGAEITFFFPMPKKWNKKVKKEMHMQFHRRTPDIDNIFKAVLDSLMAQDRSIAQVTLAKKWVDHPEGWIEVTFNADLMMQNAGQRDLVFHKATGARKNALTLDECTDKIQFAPITDAAFDGIKLESYMLDETPQWQAVKMKPEDFMCPPKLVERIGHCIMPVGPSGPLKFYKLTPHNK